MKTIISICISLMFAYSVVAQNKEPKFLVEDVFVIDTLEAEKIAELKRGELIASIDDEKKIVSEELSLLSYISSRKKKTIKKDDDISLMIDIVDRCVKFQGVFNDKAESIKEGLRNGVIDPIFHKDAKTITIRRLSLLSIPEISDINKMSFSELVDPLPTKTIQVTKPNPNFAYRWIASIDTETLSYNPLKDVYTSGNYPQYTFRKCSYDYHSDDVWAIFDKSDNLVSTQMGFDLSMAKTELINACVKYDYTHNAYGINEESLALRNCVESILNGTIPMNDDYLAGALMQTSLLRTMARQSLRSGLITLKEYNDVVNGADAAIKKQQDEIDKQLKKFDSNTLATARKYVQTLKENNEDLIQHGFGYERNDDLEALITFKDLTLKQLFSYSEDENKITSDFEVIKKDVNY